MDHFNVQKQIDVILGLEVYAHIQVHFFRHSFIIYKMGYEEWALDPELLSGVNEVTQEMCSAQYT